jgi:deazaflavin-dependent oxidoreductase (nitroreductase family)
LRTVRATVFDQLALIGDSSKPSRRTWPKLGGPGPKGVAKLRQFMALVGVLLLGLLTVAIVFVLGMRARSQPLLTAVRRLNRALFNPRQMRSAGSPGAFASVIRHTGRTSGRAYETPVGAVPTDDGFVIVLVYGSRTDWLENVLASGSATIVNEGHAYRVHQPEVIPLKAAAAHLPASDRRAQRLIGVDQCLRVRRVDPEAAPEG